MRLDLLTVRLRARSSWEAMELGMALVRRHAGDVCKPWLLLTVPVFVLLNAAAWAIDQIWLAALLMWWLKPVFDRIPLYVISRAVFGATPRVKETLAAQARWGWKPMLHYLSWRRFGPARSLYLPIDLLEGVGGARLGERRSVLGGAVYGNAALLTLVCLHFEGALVLACGVAVFLFVPLDYLPETARAAWSLISEQPPAWAQVARNAFLWLATSLIEPFFVGAGFGLYLNRRTQIEAWDVEIEFRKLRKRLLAAAGPVLALLLLAGTSLTPLAQAQERSVAPPPQQPGQAEEKATPPTLPIVFGEQRVDDRRFREAADRAYEDPLLNGKRTHSVWEKREKEEQKQEPTAGGLPAWLSSVTALLAFIAEWGLWLLVAALVIVMLATMRYWLPWMRGTFKRQAPLPTQVGTETLQVPEALPDDIATTARKLWNDGRHRHALALLYRASVETMVARTGIVLPPGATEAQCLRASRRMPGEADRGLFARMVRVWQYAAYAQQLPDQDEFDALLIELQQRYRWAA